MQSPLTYITEIYAVPVRNYAGTNFHKTRLPCAASLYRSTFCRDSAASRAGIQASPRQRCLATSPPLSPLTSHLCNKDWRQAYLFDFASTIPSCLLVCARSRTHFHELSLDYSR